MTTIHSSGYNELNECFKNEKIQLSPAFTKEFMELISKICIYEEEEKKIRPLIIIGNSLDNYFIQCSFHFKQEIYTDDLDGSNFKRLMKSLIPLCINNWYVYIDLKDDCISYGIFRQFKSAVSIDFEEMFFANDNQYVDSIGLICLKPHDHNSFIVKSITKQATIISFSFIDDFEQSVNDINNLTNDIIQCVDEEKEYISKAVYRILSYLPQKLHGAICLVVEEAYIYPNSYLSGLNLLPSLDLISCIRNTKEVSSYEDAERYYAITNLLYEFLNVDGITIISASGKIRGYNAFYRSSDTPLEVVGGARKRTFEGLIHEMNKENSKILGVYYQSQDGNYKYVRRNQNE